MGARKRTELSGAALRAGTGPLEVGAKTRKAAEAREETSSREDRTGHDFPRRQSG